MATTAAPQTKLEFVRAQALRSNQALLAIHGLSLTMDQIADESGISRRSLFRHFESRDALVRSALDAAIADYERQLAEATMIEGEPGEWLTSVIAHAHRSHRAAGLAIWQISSTADSQLPEELIEVTRRRRAMRRRATKQLTTRAWEAHGGTGPAPDVVAEAMAMAVSSYATHSLVIDLGQSVDEAARLSAAIITAVIQANLAPAS